MESLKKTDDSTAASENSLPTFSSPAIAAVCFVLMSNDLSEVEQSWHQKEHETVRTAVKQFIAHLIGQRRPGASEKWVENLSQVAAMVENRLYKTAKSFTEYNNAQTVISRIEELVEILISEALDSHDSIPSRFVHQDGVDKEGLLECITTAGTRPEPSPIHVESSTGPEEPLADIDGVEIRAARQPPSLLKPVVSCQGCSRLFIVKVLRHILDHLKKRSSLHESTSQGYYSQGMFSCSRDMILKFFTLAKTSCADLSNAFEHAYYGGPTFNVQDPSTHWTEPNQLLTWWKNNIERRTKLKILQDEMSYCGTDERKACRARWCGAVVTLSESIRTAANGRSNGTPSLSSSSPSRAVLTNTATEPSPPLTRNSVNDGSASTEVDDFDDSAPLESASGTKSVAITFPMKLFDLVSSEDPSVVCWQRCGTSFQVKDLVKFTNDILPKRFKHNNFTSFQRQLNLYGFRRASTTDRAAYCHPFFLQYQRQLACTIKRSSSYQSAIRQSADSENLSPTIESADFIDDELTISQQAELLLQLGQLQQVHTKSSFMLPPLTTFQRTNQATPGRQLQINADVMLPGSKLRLNVPLRADDDGDDFERPKRFHRDSIANKGNRRTRASEDDEAIVKKEPNEGQSFPSAEKRSEELELDHRLFEVNPVVAKEDDVENENLRRSGRKRVRVDFSALVRGETDLIAVNQSFRKNELVNRAVEPRWDAAEKRPSRVNKKKERNVFPSESDVNEEDNESEQRNTKDLKNSLRKSLESTASISSMASDAASEDASPTRQNSGIFTRGKRRVLQQTALEINNAVVEATNCKITEEVVMEVVSKSSRVGKDYQVDDAELASCSDIPASCDTADSGLVFSTTGSVDFNGVSLLDYTVERLKAINRKFALRVGNVVVAKVSSVSDSDSSVGVSVDEQEWSNHRFVSILKLNVPNDSEEIATHEAPLIEVFDGNEHWIIAEADCWWGHWYCAPPENAEFTLEETAARIIRGICGANPFDDLNNALQQLESSILHGQKLAWSSKEVEIFIAESRRWGDNLSKIWRNLQSAGINRSLAEVVDFYYRVYCTSRESCRGGVRMLSAVFKLAGKLQCESPRNGSEDSSMDATSDKEDNFSQDEICSVEDHSSKL